MADEYDKMIEEDKATKTKPAPQVVANNDNGRLSDLEILQQLADTLPLPQPGFWLRPRCGN
ncbi:MAG: hypothetical protein ABSE73_12820 [Planctomycetota bacterium]